MLGEPLVSLVGMEAEALLPSVIASYGTKSIAWMAHQRPALEPQRACAAIGLADAPWRGFQPMELPSMHDVWHPIP
jgi:hypothetical protein